MKRRTFLSLTAAGAAACLAGCGAAESTVTPDFVLTYAENQPAGYPTTRGAQQFARLVEEQTGGKVIVQVKENGEYGTEEEVWAQVQMGGIDFARLSLSVLTDDLPGLNVLMLPCLYRNSAHLWRVLDGQLGTDFLSFITGTEGSGAVGLSWYDAGARSFYAKTPIRSLADLQGMTIRVQDAPIIRDMVTLLGAQPVTFAYSDVYAAFEQEQIDAAENNLPAYQVMDHYKIAPYYTLDEHSRIPEVQLASARTWDALPQEYRDIIASCAQQSADYERQLWTQRESAARQAVQSAGCSLIYFPTEEQEAFRTLVKPLWQKYCGDYQDIVEQIQEL